MTYQVAGILLRDRLEAMRAAVEWFASAGGDNDPEHVAGMQAENIADEIIVSGWEMPDETDRDELVALAQHTIDCAQVEATLNAIGTRETERLLCRKMNARKATIEGIEDITVKLAGSGQYVKLSPEQVADFGRWLREIS